MKEFTVVPSASPSVPAVMTVTPVAKRPQIRRNSFGAIGCFTWLWVSERAADMGNPFPDRLLVSERACARASDRS
ncbi:hypothetical protein AB0N60_31780 [Streptomyces microflavus]|nr:hypothetical protein [Streptomyces microflavus]WSA65553.1 hypothetical protein OHB31_19630 [Streptomyces microflavus]